MTNIFNTVSQAPQTNDAMTVIWVIVITALGMAWLAFFDNYWVAYTANPTKAAHREMRIAAFAPITVPILAGMLIVKTAREVKSVTA